jgi:hypothetical protein
MPIIILDFCRTPRFLVAGVLMSAGFSVVSSLVYLVVHVLLYFDYTWDGRLNRGMVNGMGIFLSFILLQTGLTMGALVNEKRFYQDTLDVLSESYDFGYDLKVYGRTGIMIAGVGSAFLLALVVLAYSTCFVPKGGGRGPVRGPDDVAGSIRVLEKYASSPSVHAEHDTV